MKTLDAAKAKERVRVSSIEGSVRLLTRLSSIGLVPGSVLEVVRNDRSRPVLVYGRDTLLAVSRKDSERIEVEEVA